MILDIQFCEELRILRLFYLIKNILNIIKIAIPIILILICTIDLFKNVISIEKQNIISKIIKRLLLAVIFFFVPTIINFSLNLVSDVNNDVSMCWNNSTKENINILQQIADQKMAASLKAHEERLKEIEEEKEKAKKEYEEYIKQLEEEEKQAILSDCVDPNTDGRVYVKNGIFYKPKTMDSGSSGTEGSAPSGMNKCFYQNLSKLIEEAKKNGYTVRVTSGWRSYSAQVATFNRYGRNPWRAAVPGKSNHGWGIAADLSYSSGAQAWVHRNCIKYGLHYPMNYEPWHIEPINIQKY